MKKVLVDIHDPAVERIEVIIVEVNDDMVGDSYDDDDQLEAGFTSGSIELDPALIECRSLIVESIDMTNAAADEDYFKQYSILQKKYNCDYVIHHTP